MNEKSIAILPFLNLSSDPENEYFSDGITEEIINALTGVDGLKVTARTSSFSFKGKQLDVRHIGNQLGVSTVLEGSVRKSKTRVRISAQLVRTDDGFQIWSQKFDRQLDDIFKLQDEISIAIAEQIRENFGHLEINEHLVDAPTKNIQAYNLYLKARYNHLRWDHEGIINAMRFYDECIALDPNFSWPYFGAGYCHSMFGSWTDNKGSLDLAEEYISKGFKIDDSSFLGYYSKATLLFWGHWKFREAAEAYKKSISLNRSYTEAEEGLAELYTAIGWFDDATRHTKHILQLDALSPNHHFTIANIHYLNEEYEKALKHSENALNINPEFTHAIALKQLCLIMLGREDDLNNFLSDNALTEAPETSRMLYRLFNEPDHSIAEPEIRSILETEPPSLISWDVLMYAQLGHIDTACDLLQKAVENRRGQYMNFLNRPLLKPLRKHNKFIQLIQQVFESSLLPADESKSNSGILYADKYLDNTARVLMEPSEVEETSALLDVLMKQESSYLDASLSLRVLAEKVGTHPNKLSWLLNDVLGMSFNDYINNYRLETFKQKALDPENHNLTLLGLAFESGFNSKSTFNNYFKKKTGMTPRMWLKKNS